MILRVGGWCQLKGPGVFRKVQISKSSPFAAFLSHSWGGFEGSSTRGVFVR